MVKKVKIRFKRISRRQRESHASKEYGFYAQLNPKVEPTQLPFNALEPGQGAAPVSRDSLSTWTR